MAINSPFPIRPPAYDIARNRPTNNAFVYLGFLFGIHPFSYFNYVIVFTLHGDFCRMIYTVHSPVNI